MTTIGFLANFQLMRNKILILAGSKSDLPKLRTLFRLFRVFGLKSSIEVISSHRNLKKLVSFLSTASDEYSVIIAVARSVSNLPAIVAGYLKNTPVTVIGVGLSNGGLKGVDSLLSVNTIPKGVPLLHTGIDQVGLYNAGLSAIRILARNDEKLLRKLKTYEF